MPLSAFIQRLATYAIWAVVILFIPSVISAALAAWSAISNGQITLYSVGKTATSREVVHWTQGWPRFASPILLLIAACIYPAVKASTPKSLLFTVLAVAGCSMLVFSLWFKAPGGALALGSLLGFVAAAHFVDARFGRTAAFFLLVAAVAALLWTYAAG
jgi:hypothetical protein